MSHEAMESSIHSVKILFKSLGKSKTSQVRSKDQLSHMKSVAHAWFKSYRPELVELIDRKTLQNIDDKFNQLLMDSDKSPSRKKVQGNLRELKNTLVSNQGKLLTLETNNANLSSDTPDFSSLIHNSEMRTILEKRWTETRRCLDSQAYLAATVMMGGLLEGLLMAKVNSYDDRSKLFDCSTVPIDQKTGKKIQLNKWTLKNYIDVAHEMNWIGKAAKEVGTVLREYRNFIHPQKELSYGVVISASDANVFWGITTVLVKELL